MHKTSTHPISLEPEAAPP